MWNKKFEKGVSIVEAMVAAAILGMLVVVFMNSSSIFMRTQQDLVKMNKQDQIADSILQDISEYVKSELNPYGNIIVESFDNRDDPTLKQINISGLTEVPEVGDIFVLEGIRGIYKIAGIPVHVSETTYTITTDVVFPVDTSLDIDSEIPITFLAFNKLELECFTGDAIDLLDPDSDCPDPGSDISALVQSWKTQMQNAGMLITKAEVEMTDEQLFKVTIGDGTNETSLAKKFVQCAFSASTEETIIDESLDFNFPGMGTDDPATEAIETDLRVATGIMEGTRNPIFHYGFNIDGNDTRTKYYDGAADDGSGGTLTDYSKDDLRDVCVNIGASPCRQNYAKHRWITVFLYRYIGTNTVTVQPAGCKIQGGWDQCHDDERVTFNGISGPDVTPIKYGDLSIWFIYSQSNSAPTVIENRVGYVGFSIEYLDQNAQVGIFDDSGESCLADIVSMSEEMPDGNEAHKCEGGYDYNGAHDGLVVHVATDQLTSLYNVALDVINPADNILGWRVLNQARCDPTWIQENEDLPEADQQPITECDRINPDPCLLAENNAESTHNNGAGGLATNEDCWTEVTAPNTLLSLSLDQGASEMSVDNTDWDKFPASGYLQVGNEAIHYTSKENNGASRKFKGLTKGVRNTVQVATNSSNWITFKDLCDIAETPPNCADGAYITDQAIHARLISGESDASQQGAKLRIARWIGWVTDKIDDVDTTDERGLKIQQRESRVFNNYQLNRFRIGNYNGTQGAVPDDNTGDDFSVGEKYVVYKSHDQAHEPSTTVYGISMELDGATANTQVSILNQSWNSSKNNVNHNSQNTITIPRKVELNFQNATTTTDTTVTCAE